MIVTISCEHCGNEDLVKSNAIVGYYCNKCDDEITMAEIETEELRLKCNYVMMIDNWDCYKDCAFWNGKKCTYHDEENE